MKGRRKPELNVERYLDAQEKGITEEKLYDMYTFSRQKLSALKRHHGALKAK